MDIFDKSIDEIFTTHRLKFALASLDKKPNDYDEVMDTIDSGKFLQSIQEGFIPHPVQKFEIYKNETQNRELTLAKTPSKIIQKILVQELNTHFVFSPHSYAYNHNRGTIRAIKRVKNLAKEYAFVAKADIDNFFDEIDIGLLLDELKLWIEDSSIIKLLATLIHNGSLKKHQWIDKEIGLYQGDNLSPVFSNLYLDGFDRFLESKHITFVRFADDILLFASSHAKAKKHLAHATHYLSKLKLRFDEEKTYIADISSGFSYLGVHFENHQYSMDSKKLAKKIQKLSDSTQKLGLEDTISKFNEHIIGAKGYYLKVLSDLSAFDRLTKHIQSILIAKIIQAKRTQKLTNKKQIYAHLEALEFYHAPSSKDKKRWIKELISQAYEQLALNRPIKEAKDTKSLMGYEGAISSEYWDCVAILIGDANYNRTTQGAKDSFNQALNYGYAVLYNLIQSQLIDTGLNIYHSIYHKARPTKPTLVYDMIEEFRQPIIDREIIAIITKGGKIKQSKDRLTKETTKLIISHIQKRLATPSKSRYGKMQPKDIIRQQAYLLKRVIDGEAKRYIGWKAKY